MLETIAAKYVLELITLQTWSAGCNASIRYTANAWKAIHEAQIRYHVRYVEDVLWLRRAGDGLIRTLVKHSRMHHHHTDQRTVQPTTRGIQQKACNLKDTITHKLRWRAEGQLP